MCVEKDGELQLKDAGQDAGPVNSHHLGPHHPSQVTKAD